MVIQYLGHASFRIKSKTSDIVIDPYDPKIGKKFPKQKEIDIVMCSHGHFDHHYLDGIESGYFLIDGPGEYDVKDVSVKGIFSYHDKSKGSERGNNTIYVMNIEDVSLCHLGDLGDVLTDDQIEKIGPIDVLFIPVGGKFTIDAHEATKVISQVEPSIVVPMHYGNTELGIDDVDKFLKEMGVEKESVKNLKISKDDFGEGINETKVIVMENV